MSPRIAVVVLALVAVPAVVFGLGKSRPSATRHVVTGWTAYPTPLVVASQESFSSAVERWVRMHPKNSDCHITHHTAVCGGSANVVVLVESGQSP